MTWTESRLEQRVRRDFPEAGSADAVLDLLASLPRAAGYDHQILADERVQTAVVLVARGDIRQLDQMLHLARADWRDILVAAGLADEDWAARLDLKNLSDSGCPDGEPGHLGFPSSRSSTRCSTRPTP